MSDYFDLRTVYPEELKKKLKKKFLIGDELETKRYFESIAKQTDGKIPKEIGEMLIAENNNPDYAILIHRTSNVDKDTIFQNGLRIAGGNDINYTMSGYDEGKMSNFNMILGIRDGSGYKAGGFYGPRCLVMKIPISALEYKEGESKPILKKSEMLAEQSGGMAVVKDHYQTTLLPEYVLGSIEYEGDKVKEFVRNPNYKDEHTHSNEGLVYTSQLMNSYSKQKEINETDKTTGIGDGRTENELKDYSKKGMLLSKFNEMAKRIKKIFSRDRTKEENKDDVISK